MKIIQIVKVLKKSTKTWIMLLRMPIGIPLKIAMFPMILKGILTGFPKVSTFSRHKRNYRIVIQKLRRA